jgi:hypothetical protein
MSQSNLATAEAYYSAVGGGNDNKIRSSLHDDVKYLDPLWPLTGKNRVFPAAKKFSAAVKQLKLIEKSSTDDRVTLVYDVTFKKSDKPLRTVVLMTFDGELIKQIELVYDTSQHMDICREIFS